MVDVDAGHDRHVGVDDVDGVEPSAQADLQDHDIEPGAGQQVHDRQRGEFEIGQRDLATAGLDGVECLHQGGIGLKSRKCGLMYRPTL
jgi:hypothetical protein